MDEEQNGKQKKERERNRERVPNPSTQDHSVASYDAQESYGEPILFTSPAHRGIYIYNILCPSSCWEGSGQRPRDLKCMIGVGKTRVVK